MTKWGWIYTTVLKRHKSVVRLDVKLYLHHKYPKWVDLYYSIKNGDINLEYIITENEYVLVKFFRWNHQNKFVIQKNIIIHINMIKK